MLNADFHMHTFFSKCSSMNPRDMIRHALSKRLDAIGVVDHDSIKGGLAAKKIAGKKILVIPGEEIKTECGDLIVFLSDGKYRGSIMEICERAKQENAFVIAPHPFDLLRHSLRGNIEKIRGSLDAVEVFNSRCMSPRANSRAEAYAGKNAIPAIGGSDAHFPEEIGNVSCRMECEKNMDSILESVRKGNIEISGSKSSIILHAKTHLAKINRLLGRQAQRQIFRN